MAEKKKQEKKQDGEKKKVERVGKKVKTREEKQLFWMILIIAIVFASVLIPYFSIENSKSFYHSHINWTIEDYEGDLRIYHGRFTSIANKNHIFNTYLRKDPRLNNVETSGVFTDFKYKPIISMSKEVNHCGSQVGRLMADLSIFLKDGVGLGQVSAALNNEEDAIDAGLPYVTCENSNMSVIIVELGENSKVIKDENNPYCYKIYAESCDSVDAIEKFMIKTVDDFENLRESK